MEPDPNDEMEDQVKEILEEQEGEEVQVNLDLFEQEEARIRKLLEDDEEESPKPSGNKKGKTPKPDIDQPKLF